MLRATIAALGSKTPKQGKGKFDRMTSFMRKRAFRKTSTVKLRTEDGDTVVGAGKLRMRQQDELVEAMNAMENPVIWIWYPWRVNPEPPQAEFPNPAPMKNLHGAVYTDLSPQQRKKEEERMFGARIPPTRTEQHDAKHPFLTKVLRELDGQPKGFPFWYKKYPTRRHAYEFRFNIPREMLDGYSEDVKKAISFDMMKDVEKTRAEKARYTERYAQHPLDNSSPAVLCSHLAVQVRQLRNHVLKNPKNKLAKQWLSRKERLLYGALRRLRKINFKQYWEIVRDHDMQDIIQPTDEVKYRWGRYWEYDWNAGLAINTNIPDFMDPRGMNGCVETGRSRAEVARDLGLTYTRSLNSSEKKMLSHTAEYFEKLQKFKTTQPEAWREKQRQNFVRKFSGMFATINFKSQAPDFPSRYRADVGTRMIRWKAVRHGPQ